MIRCYTCLAMLVLLLCAVPALGTSEHDNDLYFEGCSGFYFRLTGYHITSGQPWDGIEHSHHGSTGKLTVKAGRHHSGDVGSWFRSRVDHALGTRHSGGLGMPDELNFAIHGDLHLSESHSTGGTAVCKGVAIGQGHVGAYNNWWIGAESGVMKTSDGEVWLECPAADGHCGGIVTLSPHDSDVFKVSVRTCPPD